MKQNKKPLLEKNGFTVFHNFLLSEILLTLMSQKYFSLVFNITITLLLIIVPVFIGPFFAGSKHYRFSERLVIKPLLLKRRTFTLTGAILFEVSRNTA